MRTRHVVLGLFCSAVLFACSKQSEGERCQLLNYNNDCDSGLLCTSARDLQATDEVDRCCPPGNTFSDSRCDRRAKGPIAGTGTGGGSATTGTGGGSQAGNAGTAGVGVGGASPVTGTTQAGAGSAGALAGASNPG